MSPRPASSAAGAPASAPGARPTATGMVRTTSRYNLTASITRHVLFMRIARRLDNPAMPKQVARRAQWSRQAMRLARRVTV